MIPHEHNEQVALFQWAALMENRNIFLAVPRINGFHGLFIEMKAGRNKTSEKQDEWISRLIQRGYLVVVCYSFEEAKKEILDYLETESILESEQGKDE